MSYAREMERSEKPKWQRARIRQNIPDEEFDPPLPSRLLWVRYGRPQTTQLMDSSGRLSVPKPAYETSWRRPTFFGEGHSYIQASSVELLPEFSFADDPDAEPTRQ